MCKYCENLNEYGEGPDIVDGGYTDRFHLWKDIDDKYHIECYSDHSAPINYCPMCGRKLNQTTAQ